MPAHALTHKTREALDNLEAYLAGLNEAVQYCVAYLADEVTQVPSGIMGGDPGRQRAGKQDRHRSRTRGIPLRRPRGTERRNVVAEPGYRKAGRQIGRPAVHRSHCPDSSILSSR